MRARLKQLMDMYGRLAVGVYIAIYALTLAGFFLLLRAGLQHHLPDWLTTVLPAEGTTFVGAWAMAKVLQIPRIALALAVTPLVARLLGRVPAPQSESA
jgi:hypothetical protein